jgi:uncharacterized membrane-anchored protein
MGETAADFLDHRYNPVVMVLCTGIALAASVWIQVRRDRYEPWTYWSAVTMVSVFGTMAADAVHVALGVPYTVSTFVFLLALGGLFTLWQRTEHTLSVHEITTTRREAFYWMAVLTTFALGTAAGDWTAITLNLGFLGSGVLFLAAFVIPGALFRWAHLNGVAAFWISYILTRPLGASFADYMGMPATRGGLGWGTGWVTVALGAMIAALVAVHARSSTLAPAGGDIA